MDHASKRDFGATGSGIENIFSIFGEKLRNYERRNFVI